VRRERFLQQVNDAYASLRTDRNTWEAVLAERRAWDATLSDGLARTEAKVPYATMARFRKPNRPRR
jgi:hypothetical protein